MKTACLKWLGGCLLGAALAAGSPVPESGADTLEEATLELTTGYRRDQLDWNIAGNVFGTNPNVLSELEWKDLDIYQLGLRGRIEAGNHYDPRLKGVLKGSASVGYVEDGTNRDSDYDGDNRTLEYSRSDNSAEGGDVVDLSVAAGLKYIPWQGGFSVTPLLGYAINGQDLRITDGYQTVASGGTPAVGPISGLDSSYEALWYGPWVGVDLAYAAPSNLKLGAGFEYHWAEYEADANWNLRSDLAHPLSFRHEADGEGMVVNLGAQWAFHPRWLLSLGWTWQKWQTNPGTDLVYYSSGTLGQSRLNEVNWESSAFNLGLAFRFR